MLLTAMFIAGAVQANTIRMPFVSPIFSDHMVLQRGRPNTFWGWTTPGHKVTVSIEGHAAEAAAGPDGKWSVAVMPPKVGGPYQVKITGPQTVTLTDVLVGDVWLCGGQSNMQFGIMGTHNGKQAIAEANHPQIRFTIVPTSMSFTPRDTTIAPWQVVSPDTVGHDEWNGLSAVGYYFGRELQKELNIPIGLVHDNRGGSSAESWISRPTLESQGDFKEGLAKIDHALATAHAEHGKNVEQWILASDPGSQQGWEKPETSTDGWLSGTLPGSFYELGIGGHMGVVWFRTEINLSNVPDAGEATLSLGAISELDWAYVNGHPVGATFADNVDRKYRFSGAFLKPGKNVITVRVLNSGIARGFQSIPDQLYLEVGHSKVSLAGGDWKLKVGPNLWGGHGEFPWDYEGHYHTPLIHYNAMIKPVAPLAIKGVIWYQGESNVGRAKQYTQLMQLVASDWRAAFDVQELPFYQVQLANYQARHAEPTDSAWAELREAQEQSAKLIPGGGLATAFDIGEADDIHPKNKLDVGLRLAHNVLHNVYGRKDLAPTGPTFQSFTVAGSKVTVHFGNTQGGLIAKGGTAKGFAIAGSDHKFHWATAKIVGNAVELVSPDVSSPVAVRYGWADNPEVSLFNGANLPAFPFRTDHW